MFPLIPLFGDKYLTPFLRGQAKKPRLCYIFNYHGNHGYYLRSYNTLLETVRCYDPRIIHVICQSRLSKSKSYLEASWQQYIIPTNLHYLSSLVELFQTSLSDRRISNYATSCIQFYRHSLLNI